MESKARIMLARFPGNNSEHPASVNWVMETAHLIAKDPRFESPFIWWKSDTPITMVRNLCVCQALEQKVDYLVMIDNDMMPDMDSIVAPSPAKFWKTSIEHALRTRHEGPCMIAAPYCGPPPHENVYIFRWRGMESSDPNTRFTLSQFTREEAAIEGGIKEVAALPTGLILIDMRVFTGFKHPTSGREVKLALPWFYYEWTDKTQSAKASTEDVTFSRDASLIGCRVLCNWDSWAVHMKLKGVGKPTTLTPKDVTGAFIRAMQPPADPNAGLLHALRKDGPNGAGEENIAGV